MIILKKTLKVYILSIILFLILTFVLAAAINFTGFKEEWAFGGLVLVMSIVTLVLGFLDGKIIEKKGLITGIGASVIFMIIILFSVGGIFAGTFGIKNFDIFYIAPILSGAFGGILGANSNS